MKGATVSALLPYAAWMALMAALPATAPAYAARVAATLVALAAAFAISRVPFRNWFNFPSTSGTVPFENWGQSPVVALIIGVIVGFIVCFLWIWPEQFAWYRDFDVLGALGLTGASNGGQSPENGGLSPYDPAVCGWPLTWVRLLGSAFVIAPVEEIFFRSFLYRWLQKADWTKVPLSRFDVSAFVWMVGLFALEHHTRLAAGVMAGAAYGILAIRRGLGAAVVAHAVTNLALGLYVIRTGQWGFW